MKFPNTRGSSSRDPCIRVKAALLSALPCKCASAAALGLTRGMKFAHQIAQDCRGNPNRILTAGAAQSGQSVFLN
jgi:hypothetical protein